MVSRGQNYCVVAYPIEAEHHIHPEIGEIMSTHTETIKPANGLRKEGWTLLAVGILLLCVVLVIQYTGWQNTHLDPARHPWLWPLSEILVTLAVNLSPILIALGVAAIRFAPYLDTRNSTH